MRVTMILIQQVKACICEYLATALCVICRTVQVCDTFHNMVGVLIECCVMLSGDIKVVERLNDEWTTETHLR